MNSFRVKVTVAAFAGTKIGAVSFNSAWDDGRGPETTWREHRAALLGFITGFLVCFGITFLTRL